MAYAVPRLFRIQFIVNIRVQAHARIGVCWSSLKVPSAKSLSKSKGWGGQGRNLETLVRDVNLQPFATESH
jgi:hypothetical protein